jgi:hypothetical protein
MEHGKSPWGSRGVRDQSRPRAGRSFRARELLPWFAIRQPERPMMTLNPKSPRMYPALYPAPTSVDWKSQTQLHWLKVEACLGGGQTACEGILSATWSTQKVVDSLDMQVPGSKRNRTPNHAVICTAVLNSTSASTTARATIDGQDFVRYVCSG